MVLHVQTFELGTYFIDGTVTHGARLSPSQLSERICSKPEDILLTVVYITHRVDMDHGSVSGLKSLVVHILPVRHELDYGNFSKTDLSNEIFSVYRTSVGGL